MRNLLLTASAIASIALPTLSLAQSNDNHPNRDRPATQHEIRQDARHDAKQDVRQDVKQDVRRDVKQDVRQDAKRDFREDVKRDVRQDVRRDVRTDLNRGRAWTPGNHTWWRGRPEFTGYAGARRGYWFVPGRGYVNPGSRWFGYGWRVGSFVPLALRGYAVVDPYVYGLPPAPRGFRYVYVGNNVALISLRNGRIVSIVSNVY